MSDKLYTKILCTACGVLAAVLVILAFADRPEKMQPTGLEYDFTEPVPISADTDKPPAKVPSQGNSDGEKDSDVPNFPININTASFEELLWLDGVGETLAERIMEERERRPFLSAEDILRVEGIGEGTLEKFLSQITW